MQGRSRWTGAGVKLGVAVVLGLAVALPALSQWAWRDANGRMVFSDQPPPPEVKPEQIVRQPREGALPPTAGAPSPPAPAAAPAQAAPAAPAPAAKKAEPSQAEIERRQAEEQAGRQRLAEDCARLRAYLRSLEEGQRIARPDGQGGFEVLDDAARAQEVARAKDRLERACKDSN